MRTGSYLTAKHAGSDFYSSFDENFIIMDNLDCKSEPMIKNHGQIYNTNYSVVIVVLRGTLHIAINGIDVHVASSEYLAIKPCMTFEIKESKCIYFCMMTQAQIMHDIYDHSKIGERIPLRCFTFHHYQFTPEDIAIIHEDYLSLKMEHLRPRYKLKGMSLRAFTSAYLAHFFSIEERGKQYNYVNDNRQFAFFDRFLKLLSANCEKERSVQFYADRLKITPKYLSSITNNFTGYSASIVIDQYVIYSIKRMLYANTHNIKTVSEMYNFPSQSFFGRYFKRITGISPNAYQKQNNRKLINGKEA